MKKETIEREKNLKWLKKRSPLSCWVKEPHREGLHRFTPSFSGKIGFSNSMSISEECLNFPHRTFKAFYNQHK